MMSYQNKRLADRRGAIFLCSNRLPAAKNLIAVKRNYLSGVVKNDPQKAPVPQRFIGSASITYYADI